MLQSHLRSSPVKIRRIWTNCSVRKAIDRPVVYGQSNKMTDKSLIAKQSSSIELKKISGTVDSTITCDETPETVSNKEHEHHECNQGINIKFENLTYRVRQNIIWDRCKLHTNKIQLFSLLSPRYPLRVKWTKIHTNKSECDGSISSRDHWSIHWY